MRGRGRVAGQRFVVADVDQSGEQLQGVLEASPGLATAALTLDAEGKHAGSAAAHIFLHQGVIGVIGQTGVVDPRDLGVILEELRHFHRVLADAVHAQRQGFQPLQDHEGIERGERRAHVSERHDARPRDVRRRAHGFGIDDAVIGNIRFIEPFEACLVFGPGEFSAVDDHAADAGAVSADELGQRMHDDVGTVFKGAA